MRAIYIKELTPQEFYHLKGDEAHHLINVIRIELDEEVLLLNGMGLKVKTRLSELSKRELTLSTIDTETVTKTSLMDLALGVPKKEALELSLKQAVELGFDRIYLIRSQYSQTKVPDLDRIESLLISALEQSNNGFMPVVKELSWGDIPFEEYVEVLMMDSQHPSSTKVVSNPGKKLLIVGPEGGFSPSETSQLHQLKNVRVLRLPTGILRTPTAVATGAGILLESLLD